MCFLARPVMVTYDCRHGTKVGFWSPPAHCNTLPYFWSRWATTTSTVPSIQCFRTCLLGQATTRANPNINVLRLRLQRFLSDTDHPYPTYMMTSDKSKRTNYKSNHVQNAYRFDQIAMSAVTIIISTDMFEALANTTYHLLFFGGALWLKCLQNCFKFLSTPVWPTNLARQPWGQLGLFLTPCRLQAYQQVSRNSVGCTN